MDQEQGYLPIACEECGSTRPSDDYVPACDHPASSHRRMPSRPVAAIPADAARMDPDGSGAGAAADRVAADRVAREATGLGLLSAHPAMLHKVQELAIRHASTSRGRAYGDVSAEATSYAVECLALEVGGPDGIPVEDDRRAIMVSVAAKRGADRAREEARRVWTGGRDRTPDTDTAPNTLPRWSDAALIARAERYTQGDLSPRSRTVYVCGPNGVDVTTRTTASRVLAGAVLDSRTDPSTGGTVLAPRRVLVKSCSRHGGGTVPSAESAYWSEHHASTLATAMECAMAMAGVPMDALTDLAAWTRTGGIHWQVVGDAMGGIPRGTVQYRTRAAANAAAKVAGYRRPSQKIRPVAKKIPTGGIANP